jgi:hypothetical protein
MKILKAEAEKIVSSLFQGSPGDIFAPPRSLDSGREAL